MGKELAEEFYQKSFIRHSWCHVQLQSKKISIKPQDFPLPLCGEHHRRKERCAPGARSGEGSEEKKLGADFLADILILSPRKP